MATPAQHLEMKSGCHIEIILETVTILGTGKSVSGYNSIRAEGHHFTRYYGRRNK